jgi:hypothetical protein
VAIAARMLHYLAILVDDFDRERERLHRLGLGEILRVEFGEGLQASFFDTRKLYGDLIELYPSTSQMRIFFSDGLRCVGKLEWRTGVSHLKHGVISRSMVSNAQSKSCFLGPNFCAQSGQSICELGVY